jgi:magnesium chelatase family protein
MNPRPYGYAGDSTKECTCSPSTVTRYQKRISGPLLDRIDIHVEAARDRQRKRFANHDSRVVCNADMTPADVRVFCRLDATGQSLMRSAMQQLQPSARAFHRVLKIARTIADLAGSKEIAPAHLAEAIQYRPRRQE